MVWKKDLAKFKEELKKEGVPVSLPPQPKPVPKPAAPLELPEEDALFLAAMGLRPAKSVAAPIPGPDPESPKPLEAPRPVREEAEGFLEAMASLKGVKRSPQAVPEAQSKPSQPLPEPATVAAQPLPVDPTPRLVEAPKPEPTPREPQRREPSLFQLAAGMAIEVDGVLDLKGHTRTDALERLRERILDGQALGWKTCHVILGASEELASAFREFLGRPEAAPIARYAQAPIPMGGIQAWILYYAIPGSSKENP